MAIKPKTIIKSRSGVPVPPRAGANTPRRRGSEVPKTARTTGKSKSRQMRQPSVPAKVPTPRTVTAGGGANPPAPPSRGAPPVGGSPDRFPVRRSSTAVTAQPAAQGRTERFMGNADVVRDASPGASRRQGRNRAVVAGGTAAAATGLLAVQDKGTSSGTQTPVKTATAPGGTSVTPPPKPAPSTPASAVQKSSVAPRSSVPKGSNTPKSKPMKGKELADFLGLGASSAVRTYMETGKHKYPSKK